MASIHNVNVHRSPLRDGTPVDRTTPERVAFCSKNYGLAEYYVPYRWVLGTSKDKQNHRSARPDVMIWVARSISMRLLCRYGSAQGGSHLLRREPRGAQLQRVLPVSSARSAEGGGRRGETCLGAAASAAGPDAGCHRARSRLTSISSSSSSSSGIFTPRGISGSSSSRGSRENSYGANAGAVRLRMDGVHTTAAAAAAPRGGGRRPASPGPLASVCGSGVGARRGKAGGTTPEDGKEAGKPPGTNINTKGEQPKARGGEGVAPAAADSSMAGKGTGGGSSTRGASGGSGGGGGGVVGDLPHQVSELYAGTSLLWAKFYR